MQPHIVVVSIMSFKSLSASSHSGTNKISFTILNEPASATSHRLWFTDCLRQTAKKKIHFAILFFEAFSAVSSKFLDDVEDKFFQFLEVVTKVYDSAGSSSAPQKWQSENRMIARVCSGETIFMTCKPSFGRVLKLTIDAFYNFQILSRRTISDFLIKFIIYNSNSYQQRFSEKREKRRKSKFLYFSARNSIQVAGKEIH